MKSTGQQTTLDLKQVPLRTVPKIKVSNASPRIDKNDRSSSRSTTFGTPTDQLHLPCQAELSSDMGDAPKTSETQNSHSIEVTKGVRSAKSPNSEKGSFVENVRNVFTGKAKASNVAVSFTRRVTDTRDGLKRMGLTHILYVLGLVILTTIGAAIFHALDGEAGDQAIEKWENRCKSLLDKATNLSNNSAVLNTPCSKLLMDVLFELDKCHRSHTTKPSLPLSTFANAMIFAITCYTTIGYGTIYPTSDGCKSATIIFILVGIPYFLALLMDIGRFLRLWFQFLWIKCRKCMKKVRKKYNKNKPKTHISRHAKMNVNINKKVSTLHRRWLPFILACIMTLLYISLLALFFEYLERPKWSFHDSFYFVIQTITLVGFGDLYPSSHAVLEISLPLLIAICFVTMCFFLLQEAIMEFGKSTTIRITKQVSQVGRRVSHYTRHRRTTSMSPKVLRDVGEDKKSVKRSRSWSYPINEEKKSEVLVAASLTDKDSTFERLEEDLHRQYGGRERSNTLPVVAFSTDDQFHSTQQTPKESDGESNQLI